jgi:two-component system, NarL family, response regulator NreC
MSEIRVMIVDDHAVLRSGLKLLLDQQPDIQVVAEVESILDATNVIEEARPDVVLLDLTMPGTSGLDGLQMLRKISPNCRILVLTMHEDESYMRRALKAGAAGYTIKKTADVELISAIRAVARGEVYIHSSMTRGLLDGLLPADQFPKDREADLWQMLSERELEVLHQVALGHTSAEIAEQLGLSAKTIETYRARGMEKLGLRSRAALVKYALAYGLLEP